MADNERSFWIRIKSLFERRGADEAQQAMRDLDTAAKTAGGILDFFFSRGHCRRSRERYLELFGND